MYSNLQNEGINNVQIIAIGKEQYSADNSKWTSNNSIPMVNDPSPNDIWGDWGASQWDLFFINRKGEYVKDINLNPWNYNAVYNTILDISQ